MKKLLPILLLAVLFISCSSDNNNEDPNNGSEMIDSKILGNWKVIYSQTIKPAVYNEVTEELSYPTNAKITEYLGDYNGHINQTPESSMFNNKDVEIDVNSDNTIRIKPGGGNYTTISYLIEDGYLKWNIGNGHINFIKYKINNNVLTMELVKSTNPLLIEYRISKYTKIVE